MKNNKDVLSIEDNKENIILAIKMIKVTHDKERFEMLLADLPKDVKDRLKFFIFNLFIKDKINFMSLKDLNFLRKEGILKDEY
jgi:hypothetical protein